MTNGKWTTWDQAVRGRIAELEKEADKLRGLLGSEKGAGRARRRKSHMSAAMRKAQSDRMRKIWQARRKAKANV